MKTVEVKMNRNRDILIIDTGGTFNKRYNTANGELEVDTESTALREIEKKWMSHFNIITILGKDSLDMTEEDRQILLDTILNSDAQSVVIIHGTDTMHLSAEFLSKKCTEKVIVFTGAMTPYSIDSTEATANLSSALTLASITKQHAVYIAMNGLFGFHTDIIKNRRVGKFTY